MISKNNKINKKDFEKTLFLSEEKRFKIKKILKNIKKVVSEKITKEIAFN